MYSRHASIAGSLHVVPLWVILGIIHAPYNSLYSSLIVQNIPVQYNLSS